MLKVSMHLVTEVGQNLFCTVVGHEQVHHVPGHAYHVIRVRYMYVWETQEVNSPRS